MNAAVVDLIDDYIEQSARFAFQEFDGLRVLRDQVGAVDDLDLGIPASHLKLRYRDVIREQIADVKTATQLQYHALFEAAAAQDAAVDDRMEECLDHDPFLPHVAEPERDDYADAMASYLRGVAEAMAPVLAEDGGAWAAVRRRWEPDEAERRLTEPFRRSAVLASHEDAMAMTVGRDEIPVLPLAVDYSREARRIFEHGEDYIHRVIADDVRRAFDEGA